MMWSKLFLSICLLAIVVGVLAGLAEQAWAVGGLDDLKIKGGDKKAKKVITAEPPTKKEIFRLCSSRSQGTAGYSSTGDW